MFNSSLVLLLWWKYIGRILYWLLFSTENCVFMQTNTSNNQFIIQPHFSIVCIRIINGLWKGKNKQNGKKICQFKKGYNHKITYYIIQHQIVSGYKVKDKAVIYEKLGHGNLKNEWDWHIFRCILIKILIIKIQINYMTIKNLNKYKISFSKNPFLFLVLSET